MDCPKNYVFGEEFYKDYDCLGCGKWLECFLAWLPTEEKASYERKIINYEFFKSLCDLSSIKKR